MGTRAPWRRAGVARGERSSLLRLAGAAAVVLAAALAGRAIAPARPAPPREPVLVPFLVDGARERVTTAAHAFIYAPDPREPLELLELSVLVDGEPIEVVPLAAELEGDPRFGELAALLERLPPELTERHSRRRDFADPEAPAFAGPEVFERREEAAAILGTLRREWAAGRPRPFVEVAFPLRLEEVFAAEDPPGTERRVTLSLAWRTAGGPTRLRSVTETLRRLAPLRPLPPTVAAAGGPLTLASGDLHVHSCHGEAIGACSPSGNCAAETLQLSGSFSYAELRSQYEALGLNWFTATDHSYCINSDAEYAAIVAECAAASDASFVCLPDIELSSDEIGPQIGSDIGDAVCIFATESNHMGAHAIQQRIPGGDDGLFGFCDGLFSDALAPFDQNVAAIRAQGGFPIANHPDPDTAFGWNSFEALVGQETNGIHGVEIWNGVQPTGQLSHVASWVRWLLAGRLLYAYSGSDTHDEAFAFGANRVLIEGPLSPASLLAALRAGRLFVSNGPSLVLELEVGGLAQPMGSLYRLPAGLPPTSATARVHYDVGPAPSTITVFGGRAGDAAESVLCQSAPVSGAGVLECSVPLEGLSTRGWVRAYAESGDGQLAAYTNPVFVEAAGPDPLVYCAPKPTAQGCVPAIGFSGTPSATGGPFTVTCEQVTSSQNGLFFYGLAPALTPFQGGTLCVAPPIRRTPVQFSGGAPPPVDCSGSFSFDLGAWVQSGVDPTLGAGVTVYGQFWFRDPAAPSTTGLSAAVQVTLGP